jgi:Sulfatase
LTGPRPRFAFHPVLLAAAYVLSMALATEAEWADIVRPLLVAMALATTLTLSGWAVFRNRWDGALAATIALLLLISLPMADFAWKQLTEAIGVTGTTVVAALVLAALVGIPALVVLRMRHGERPLRRPPAGVLNVFSVILVAVVVLPTVGSHAPAAVDQWTASNRAITVPPQATRPPDIVLILLDGYPRTDVLQRRLGIDNTDFLDGLRSRGFDVATDSRSNYTFTGLTLASMFDMRYLDEIPRIQPLIGTPGPHHDALRDTAAGGAAFDVLRTAGYRIEMATADWEHVRMRSADVLLDGGQLTDLERKLLERTWLPELISTIAPNWFVEQERDLIVHHFDAIEEFATQAHADPTFLYVHIPGPHAPQVVDANGDALPMNSRLMGAKSPDEMGISRAEFIDRFAGEIAYLDERTLAAVDALQATDSPPVIIVMSDHGYTQEVVPGDDEALLSNLIAAFTPGAPGLLADAPTPVNLFASLSNYYLATDLQLRSDASFVSASDSDPLLVHQVP